jgi:UDP-glucose 4-epimerase
MDLTNDREVRAACEGMDTIIHLAALNEHESLADPMGALLVNGAGTLKLLEAAIAEGVRRVIYFSTAHVYGSPLIGRITEATVPRLSFSLPGARGPWTGSSSGSQTVLGHPPSRR